MAALDTGFEHGDALLDELDATLMMLGRLMMVPHGEQCAGHAVSGPRLMLLRVLAQVGPTKSGDLAAELGIKAPAPLRSSTASRRGPWEREQTPTTAGPRASRSPRRAGAARRGGAPAS